MTGDKHAKVVLGDGAAGDVGALSVVEDPIAAAPSPAPARKSTSEGKQAAK